MKNTIMNKCEFCDASGPDGKCRWSCQSTREDDCRKAIKRMSAALGVKDEKKKKWKW